MPSDCSPAADNVFGPAVGAGCRDGFDFTLLFEQSILSILPAAIILIASPFRIKYLLSKGIRTRYNPVRIAKLVRSPPQSLMYRVLAKQFPNRSLLPAS